MKNYLYDCTLKEKKSHWNGRKWDTTDAGLSKIKYGDILNGMAKEEICS